MRTSLEKWLHKAQAILSTLKKENGQDLVEYALVVALVAFAATAGMSSLASGINSAFLQIATVLGAYIT